ncbi:MAG: hypothetical protein KAT48_00005, partial [Bacteroidales bacterium]|nr:hypothetical protein [Bacteroidales bacterium]
MKNENLLKLVTRSAIMFFVMLSLGLTLNAQVAVPDGVNYQAIARDAVTGAPLADQLLEVKALIYDGTTLIISEEFTVTTNGFGLFTLTIGTGVSWAAIADPMIEVQVFLGGVWESMGTVDVLSVPYAAVAGNVAYYDGSNLFLGDGSIIPLVPDGAPGVVEANKTVVAGPDKELATFGDFTIGGTATMTATVYMTHNADANSINSGTLQVDGGAGIAKNLFVGQALNVTQKAWVGNNNTVPLEIHGDGECLGGYTDGTLVVDGDAGFNYDVRMAADLYVLCGMIWGDLTGDVTGNVTGDLYGTADHALEANHALKADSAFHAIDANEALHALEA